MDKIENYINAINFHYSNLKINSAEFNLDGQYNVVLIINNSLIFRFAKVQSAISTLRQEVSFLKYLQDKVTLPIPNPTYVCIDSDSIGEAFVGYSMIPGKSLWRDKFESITNQDSKKKLAAQLACFLNELHQDEIAKRFTDYPNNDDPKKWSEMYKEIKQKLYSFMRPDARQLVSKHFENFLNHPNTYRFAPKLRHGDFGTGNILLASENYSIAGIIDFGSAGIGDPATDFAGLLISYGEEFYKMCFPIYPEMEYALERVKFYIGTFALQEALYGYDNDDKKAFEAGMKTYV